MNDRGPLKNIEYDEEEENNVFKTKEHFQSDKYTDIRSCFPLSEIFKIKGKKWRMGVVCFLKRAFLFLQCGFNSVTPKLAFYPRSQHSYTFSR